jgi:DNA polymerase III subunit alpha
MSPGFVHLRVHSEYSLVDSVLRVGALMDAAESMAMPAVALTDLGNVSAMVKFYRGAMERGIKPVLGADLKIAAADDDRETTRLTLLVMNAAGFRNLSRLLTACHAAAGAHGGAALPREQLNREALEGLIALSGAAQGEIGRALLGSRPERASDALAFWQALMPGRFYIELERLGRPEEDAYLPGAVELAAAEGVPVVATNEVCFLTPADFEAHETRVCISHGRTLADPGRPRHYTEQQYLKPAAEMAELFSDLPEALANSVEIATRCSFELVLGEVFLPDFALPAGVSEGAHLRNESERGLAQRLEASGVAHDAAARAVYDERLDRELGVISTMGFPGYFLIVADFIRWARENRDSGGTWPRLRRRLAGRLCAGHHRSRPA